MGDVQSERFRAPGRGAANSQLPLTRVLAGVDGSERSNGIVEFLVEFAKNCRTLQVVVLNVQPSPENWRLRGYESFKYNEVIDRLINDLGKPIVYGVGQRLQKAGITFSTRVEVGFPVDVILRCAEEEHCGLIIVGKGSPGRLRQWMLRSTGVSLGSIENSVAQLSNLPVVVTK